MTYTLRFKPYTTYPEENTVRRENGRFQVKYLTALEDMAIEFKHLGAREVIVSTGHSYDDIRQDGWPRSTAREPRHPGVILYIQAKKGDMVIPCDRYFDWKHNLRAIGLTLEALRSIDRHGASLKGKQYEPVMAVVRAAQTAQTAQGNQTAQTSQNAQAGAPKPKYDPTPAEQGLINMLNVIGELKSVATYADIRAILKDKEKRMGIYRQAVIKMHPDAEGGSHEAFIRLGKWREAIEAEYPLT